ncbi:MAG: hypothetical protein Q9195_003854 [Heterodermia aff. obscurata]
MENILAGYPPAISHGQLSNLIFNIKDWQITHGMQLKYGPDVESISSTPIGVSVFPTPFPRLLFEQAQELQPIYNRLYAAISEDEGWLYRVLKGLIDHGHFAAVLWGIHQQVKQEGYVQDITLGLFRSDYMVYVTPQPDSRMELRQIELNTFSVAGGAHSNKAAQMHEFMLNSGNYTFLHSPLLSNNKIPKNETIGSLAAGLRSAHTAYGQSRFVKSSTPGVLFVVQPRNVNICDERPLEYVLWEHDIPAYRAIFGTQLLEHTTLSPSRELLYHPPSLSEGVEIAVVYMRAGYDFEEYSPAGVEARFRLERSRAIKCPSILSHLATFKKVQQELAIPGVLEKFLSPKEAAIVSGTFAPMFPLDEESIAGKTGRQLACDPKTASSYVLKPSLEGGGHNIYRGDIPGLLSSTPEAQWHTYILMEMINPLIQKNILLTPRGIYDKVAAIEDRLDFDADNEAEEQSRFGTLSTKEGGPTVSELGIFGVCMWQKSSSGLDGIMLNAEAGWSFKTKPDYVDETSVVKGFGCFDSPLLIDT